MSEGDASLNQALSQLSEAADIEVSDEAEDVARVRKARANVTERARQNGDCASSLLTGLIGESNAELESEKEEIQRVAREAEERKKAEAAAEAAKQSAEAQARIVEEKKKFEEAEKRRLQMLADLEKKRKQEAGEVDEEEEQKKRAEADAEAARIAAQKAHEAAVEAALSSDNEELAEKIRLMRVEKEARENAAASSARKKKAATHATCIIAALVVIAVLSFYFINKKAEHFYKLNANYQTISLPLDAPPMAKFASSDIRFREVTQNAPASATKKRGKAVNNDIYGVGNSIDVLGGSGNIIK